MNELNSAAATHQRALVTVLIVTASYLVVEIVGGVYTGSLALLADAGHMFTDVAGLGLALFAIRFAQRPATPERSYGFYRAEILAALANAIVLVGISLYILAEAYRRFRHPEPVASGWMLAVALVGLVVNLAGIVVLRKGSGASLNVKGAYFEVLSDLVSSLGVITAAAVVWTTGWRYADPLVSAGIGLFILPRTWGLLRSAVGVLLEGAPADVDINLLRKSLEAIEGVRGIHDMHVWALTSAVNALTVHVVRDGTASHDEVLRRVHDLARTFPIAHATVQVESTMCRNTEEHP